jgi:hypothetical protein
MSARANYTPLLAHRWLVAVSHGAQEHAWISASSCVLFQRFAPSLASSQETPAEAYP